MTCFLPNWATIRITCSHDQSPWFTMNVTFDASLYFLVLFFFFFNNFSFWNITRYTNLIDLWLPLSFCWVETTIHRYCSDGRITSSHDQYPWFTLSFYIYVNLYSSVFFNLYFEVWNEFTRISPALMWI